MSLEKGTCAYCGREHYLSEMGWVEGKGYACFDCRDKGLWGYCDECEGELDSSDLIDLRQTKTWTVGDVVTVRDIDTHVCSDCFKRLTGTGGSHRKGGEY